MRDTFLFHFKKIPLTLALWIFSSTQALPLAIQSKDPFKSQSIEAFQKALSGDSIIPKIPLKNIKVFTDQESLFSQFFSLFNTQIINKITNKEAKMFLSFVNGPSPLEMADLFVLKDDHKTCLSYYFSIQKDASKLSPLIGLLIMFLMEYSLNYQNLDRLIIFEKPLFEKLADDFFQNIPKASLNTIRENYLKNLPTLQEQIASLDFFQKQRFLDNLKNLLIASQSKWMITRHFRKSCFDDFYKEQAEDFLSLFERIKTSSSESSSFLRNSRDEILQNFKNFQNSPFGKALELDRVLPVKKILLFGKRTDRIHIFSKILLDESLFVIIPEQYTEKLRGTPSSLSVFILKNIFEKVFEKKFGKSRNKFQREFAVLLSLRHALKLSDPINFESTWRVFMQNSEKIISENIDFFLWDLMKDDQYEFFWETLSLKKEDLAEEIKTFESTYFTDHPEHISLRKNILQLRTIAMQGEDNILPVIQSLETPQYQEVQGKKTQSEMQIVSLEIPQYQEDRANILPVIQSLETPQYQEVQSKKTQSEMQIVSLEIPQYQEERANILPVIQIDLKKNA